MSSPILKVVKLQTSFGLNEDIQLAVDDVSFSINKGETFALLGESGSGKSITALSIMRLLPAAARINQGSIFLDDKDLLTLPEYAMRDIRGSRIAMIFQEPQTSLNPELMWIAIFMSRFKSYLFKQLINTLQSLLLRTPDSLGDHSFSNHISYHHPWIH